MDSRGDIILDENDFRKIYDSYYLDICRSLSYYTADLHAVEDVVQDVFVNLWRNRAEIRVRDYKAYLLYCARNRMLNLLRDKRRRLQLIVSRQAEAESPTCAEDDGGIDQELVRLVHEAIAKLPRRCREVYLLSKEEGLTYKQIAGQLGISVKTVESQMGIALRKIREEVSGDYRKRGGKLPSIILTYYFLW